MERIGFAGLGRMGQAMAGRLLAGGFPLAVYNRTRSKAEELLAQGASWADTPAALTGQADIILTILTDDRAIEQVYNGAHGLLAGDCAGKLFVEMSTIRTSTILALRPKVEARGAQLLDVPVSGTLEPARQGQLLAMVGGRAEDLARARPALELLCRRIVHLGPSGSGTTMKLALNMPMAIFWSGLAEAMAMGSQFGLDRAQMLDVYLDSPVALPARASTSGCQPHDRTSCSKPSRSIPTRVSRRSPTYAPRSSSAPTRSPPTRDRWCTDIAHSPPWRSGRVAPTDSNPR